MKQRILTALLLICILLPVLFFSGTVAFPVVAAVFCFVAVYEMLCCLGTMKKPAISVPILILAALLPLAVLLLGRIDASLHIGEIDLQRRLLFILLAMSLFVLLMFYLFAIAVFARRSITFSEVATSFLASFYVINSFLAILLIRYGQYGNFYYLLCFLGPWVTDIFAYFTGYFFGKHKLIPEISPKKTIEGSIGGIAFCVLAFLLFGVIVSGITATSPNYIVLASLGLLVSVFSQVGDLFASLLKRERGVKDYGNIFPGHGGVMDRFDSVLACTPLLLIVCMLDGILPATLLL